MATLTYAVVNALLRASSTMCFFKFDSQIPFAADGLSDLDGESDSSFHLILHYPSVAAHDCNATLCVIVSGSVLTLCALNFYAGYQSQQINIFVFSLTASPLLSCACRTYFCSSIWSAE